MCSSRGLCNSGERAADRPARSESAGSGAHYALCALGVGLIALGVVMIVWTVIPVDGEASGTSTNTSSNTTADDTDSGSEEGELSKSSSVAIVLVGVGLAMLLLSICLGIRSKRRANSNPQVATTAAASAFLDHVAGEQEDVPDPTTFNVPSYEEVVGSSDYPVRQSNLRQSNTHLPSYEDIIAAVENEDAEQPAEDAPLSDGAPSPAAEPQADAARQPSLPARSASRASRLLRPLRVRRIKSDKLHLKDFRIQIRSPTTNPVNIEPITPPPQYDNKPPELG
ncbi:transmembrane protein 51b [Corythoichthys intestinalis]|uniref:transmembrane protein 51b n=1 Tax=Corythoichthys intestinalis TaxID=161448 RepID=UPI0025A5B5DA|nr:transmembrane protein 51b [Corythoichthys intestinalis]XP_061814682.1 transmembrane protein 51-like [Nerophis lumbriciformis]